MAEYKINLKAIIQRIEDGLNNALAKKRGADTIRFRIHTSVGWKPYAERDGNTATHYINCGVDDVAISNSKVREEIGKLEFNILLQCPLAEPKTEAGDDEHVDYDGSEYPFFNMIFGVIRNFFSRTLILKDVGEDSTKQMKFACDSSVAIGQTLRQTRQIAIAISGTFAPSTSVFSNEIKILIDGEEIPQQGFPFPTTDTSETVIDSDRIARIFNTSTSMTLTITVPLEISRETPIGELGLRACRPDLAELQNRPHFLEIQGVTPSEYPVIYFVLFENPQITSSGTDVASVTANIVQATKITPLLNISRSIGKDSQHFPESKERTIKISSTADTYVKCANFVGFIKANKYVKVPLKPTDYYVKSNGGTGEYTVDYCVDIIYSNASATVTTTTE